MGRYRHRRLQKDISTEPCSIPARKPFRPARKMTESLQMLTGAPAARLPGSWTGRLSHSQAPRPCAFQRRRFVMASTEHGNDLQIKLPRNAHQRMMWQFDSTWFPTPPLVRICRSDRTAGPTCNNLPGLPPEGGLCQIDSHGSGWRSRQPSRFILPAYPLEPAKCQLSCSCVRNRGVKDYRR
jgi:hypothetical protein